MVTWNPGQQQQQKERSLFLIGSLIFFFFFFLHFPHHLSSSNSSSSQKVLKTSLLLTVMCDGTASTTAAAPSLGSRCCKTVLRLLFLSLSLSSAGPCIMGRTSLGRRRAYKSRHLFRHNMASIYISYIINIYSYILYPCSLSQLVSAVYDGCNDEL